MQLNYICPASGLLAKRIPEELMSADYFLSANNKWMNALVKAGYVDPAAVKTYWENQLVVIFFNTKMFSVISY